MMKNIEQTLILIFSFVLDWHAILLLTLSFSGTHDIHQSQNILYIMRK